MHPFHCLLALVFAAALSATRAMAADNTGIFNVLGDGHDDHLAVLGDPVDLELFGIFDEFGDDDRMVGRDDGGFF